MTAVGAPIVFPHGLLWLLMTQLHVLNTHDPQTLSANNVQHSKWSSVVHGATICLRCGN